MVKVAAPFGRRPWGRLFALLTLAGTLVGTGVVGAAAATAPAATRLAAVRPVAHAVVSTSRCARNRAAGTIAFASPFGYDASVGILDVEEAQRLGYFSALCLKVAFVGAANNPYALVSSGAAQITGEGSAADTLQAVATGSRFTAIATFGNTSDYALLTRPGIRRLTQLAGKSLAYHGTALPVALTEMLQAAHVDLAKVHLVSDKSYDPFLLTQGKFDALQAYRSNEPITLRAAHQAFREYVPSAFGVRGTFNVQVVNSAFLAAHRSVVADFLRAELHAFNYCAAHAKACVAGEAKAAAVDGVPYDKTHNLAEWRFEVALARKHHLQGKGIGVQSFAEWRPEAAALLAHRIVSSLPLLAKVEDTTLAAALYKGAALVWPGS